jgi:hypothetical protein
LEGNEAEKEAMLVNQENRHTHGRMGSNRLESACMAGVLERVTGGNQSLYGGVGGLKPSSAYCQGEVEERSSTMFVTFLYETGAGEVERSQQE